MNDQPSLRRLQTTGLVKRFGGLLGDRPRRHRRRRRRDPRADRSQRRRQDHADLAAHRRAASGCGRHLARAAPRSRARRAQRARRPGPLLPDHPGSDGVHARSTTSCWRRTVAQRRARGPGSRCSTTRRMSKGARQCRRAGGPRTARRRAGRATSATANGASWNWRWRWRWSRRCCCSTSRWRA